MTDAVQIALIVSVAPTVVAAGALLQSLKNGAKIAHVDKVAVATHALSNSAMEAQLLANVQNLELAAVAFRRLAESGVEGDVAASKAIDLRSEAAREELRKHQMNQAKVDARADT